ncbi:hypothetical protein B0J18DRAFT_410831 [Chaetomium sp. MPI-SDFR-AT-0129]|nr:hypothetical protein B0J18DRAFT_410831 [Chaetomium sp. MPI-SDFR-AT-0129]
MTEILTDEDAASARAAEQARLRKARREAKIKAGAENRLNRITGLGGGVPRDPAPAPANATTSTTEPLSTATPDAKPSAQHADPDEVDISEHFYQPQTTARIPPPTASDAQLRQLMLGLDQPGASAPGAAGAGGFPGMGGLPGLTPPPGMEDDPMMRMMMQMMGGANGPNGGGNPFAGMPGFGAAGPGTGNPLFPQQAQAQQPALPNRSASLWRLLHTLVALALGVYIALWTPFTGTKLARDRAAAAAAGSAEERAYLGLDLSGDGTVRSFFWAFATAEAVLLGTRFFLADRGKALGGAGGGFGGGIGGGILGLAVGFLPPGIKRKVDLVTRYGQVLGTVRGDVLVCVFVLGVASWVRGG